MKSLKVTTVSPFGEASWDQPIGEILTEAEYIVAILTGVTNAGGVIKSFEVVEV
jgi:hypothetical protein